MSRVAIIPARSGSKRIPLKNIKLFLGYPIISYSINAIKNSNLYDKIIVSTDSKEIAKIALSFGAEVPFLRSIKNSSDRATTSDALIEVINNLKKANFKYETLTCVYPCSPFVTPNLLTQSVKILDDENPFSVFPVVSYGHPIQRGFYINKYNEPDIKINNDLNLRTQDLNDFYHDCGMFYTIKVSNFMSKKTLISRKSKVIIIKESMSQDIDTIEDWKIAELKFKINND